MKRLRDLNLTPTDVPARDQNVCTKPQETLYKETMTLGTLDDDELEIFKAQFGALLAAPGSEERKLMLDRLPIYIVALRAIKHELGDIKFRGLNPEDTELGFGAIRPGFTRAATTWKTTWAIALTTTWADWLYEGATTPYQLDSEFGLVVTHLKSLVTPTPFMAEAKFQIARTGILIPVDTRGLRMGDTENGVSIVPIPSMIIKPKATFYARARSDVAGTDEVQLGGLVIGLGRVLKEEVPSWVPG